MPNNFILLKEDKDEIEDFNLSVDNLVRIILKFYFDVIEDNSLVTWDRIAGSDLIVIRLF